jgi:hypothetical protein
LARLLGKPQSVVSGYEAGKRRVDVVEFLLIVRALAADPVGYLCRDRQVIAQIAGTFDTRGWSNPLPAHRRQSVRIRRPITRVS